MSYLELRLDPAQCHEARHVFTVTCTGDEVRYVCRRCELLVMLRGGSEHFTIVVSSRRSEPSR